MRLFNKQKESVMCEECRRRDRNVDVFCFNMYSMKDSFIGRQVDRTNMCTPLFF